MQGDVLALAVLPASLAFIMFALGLGLVVEDFARILKQPRALLTGILCHFILLPLVCFLLLKAVGMGGAFAVGFMILAACPTGTTSNLLTYLARGDVALALSFTAVASLLTIGTMPALVSWSLAHFTGETRTVDVPVAQMMVQVFAMLGLPVFLGMALRALRPALAIRIEPAATRIATLLFLVIVVLAVIRNREILAANIGTLAPFALALNLTMLAIGFSIARLLRLSLRQSVTLGIESSIQNAALALVIASSVLGQDVFAVPGAVYGVMMYAGGLIFVATMRRILPR